jgi:CRISPR-associated protein Cas1
MRCEIRTEPKISNCRRVLQRAARDHEAVRQARRVEEVIHKLRWSLSKLRIESDIDVIRGIEGEAARTYFTVFNDLVTADKETFAFAARTRRPPRDPANALLSFVYSLLLHDVESALGAVGLDPQVGFLHRDRPGRPGLALDLMEEMRPFIGDRVVLSLINRKQVRSSGFEVRETGGVYMSDDTRRTILTAYQERKKEELIHPFLNEKLTVGRIPFVQALLLARHVRGDLDGYPPFLWK